MTTHQSVCFLEVRIFSFLLSAGRPPEGGLCGVSPSRWDSLRDIPRQAGPRGVSTGRRDPTGRPLVGGILRDVYW